MSYLPSNPNATLIDAFKAMPEIAAPLHRFSEALMRGPSPFTAAERELIATRVSQGNGCKFCRDAHATAARNLGTEDAVIDAVTVNDTANVSDRIKPVLAYVDKLNRAPGSVTQADIDAMLNAGWDETAVQHACLVCGFFSLMNRWVEGLGIESDPQTVAMAGQMLAKDGYAALAKMLEG